MNKKFLFSIIFTVLGLAAFQVSISKIIGSSQSFTLFELLGPVGGMFLGPILGALSVFAVRALNVVFFNQQLDFLTVVRFLPMMLAAVYFGLKTKKIAIIFPICIALFLLNPIGRQAWLYPMIWLIPFFATFFKKHLILNSLGATFTAHAVGSVIFLYSFGLTPAVWISLIPVVFIERGVFTLGIFTSCLVFNFVLDKITNLKFASALKPFVKQELLFNAGKSN
ncbi:MAG: hypothetical protein Q8Q48_04080 [Candidatus Staskawiczbacteria bacterium]|nr:hypothetical protein [Candidatus Staskawiczbacteria bacterium]